MHKRAFTYCSDFNTKFYESRSGKIKPIGSFLQQPDMPQRTSHSNGSMVGEGMSPQDKHKVRGMARQMLTQTDLENLQWPQKKYPNQQQMHYIKEQDRVCSQRPGIGLQRGYQQGEYHSQQQQQNFNQNPGMQQQTYQNHQQQQQPQYLDQKYQCPPMVQQQPHPQYLQTSYQNHPQEQSQHYHSQMKASPVRAGTNEYSHAAFGQPSAEENFEDNFSGSDENTSYNKYLQFMPEHNSYRTQPKQQYGQDLYHNSPQRCTTTKDLSVQRTHQHNLPLSYNNITDMGIDEFIREVERNTTGEHMEYATKGPNSRPESCENFLNEFGRPAKQQPEPMPQTYSSNTSQKQTQRSPSQYSVPRVQEGWARENAGELQAERAAEKNFEAEPPSGSGCHMVNKKFCNKCMLSSGESSSAASTVISVKSGDDLRSMVRDELRCLARDRIELQSVYGKLPESVVWQVKEYLCGRSKAVEEKNAAKDNAMDIKQQESYQSQNKALTIKGISKAKEVHKTMEYAPLHTSNQAQYQEQPQEPHRQHSHLHFQLEVQKNPQQKQTFSQSAAFTQFSRLSDANENDSYDSARDNAQNVKQQQLSQSQNKASPSKGSTCFPCCPTHKFMDYAPQQDTTLSRTRQTYQEQPQPLQHSPPNLQLESQTNSPEDNSDQYIFKDAKKPTPTRKCMDCEQGKGCQKDKYKPKQELSVDEQDRCSTASGITISTTISAKTGEELRSMVRDELELLSVRGEQASRCNQLSATVSATPIKSLGEPVSTRSVSSSRTDDTQTGPKQNLAIVNAPLSKDKESTTDSSMGSTTGQNHSMKCCVSVDDLVNCKVITPMIMKIHNKYMTLMQDEMHLMQYLEKVPHLVGQIYKDNVEKDQRRA
ncbi:GATA zinc finger domain-containing protein 10-like [Drosophila subobscura]|uniref:GATA zinc finger domain-containing protein 10-like n=1 Tax=Drosophila subobscura TaxID=7241 RepID=UPI00155A0B28|nr:GATA zinc finger domain-containing protein 10-like [Drosophila subobscura]